MVLSEADLDLYMNHYKPWEALAECVRGELPRPWVISSDDAPEIRRLYKDLRRVAFGVDRARARRVGSEILILATSHFPAPGGGEFRSR